MNNKQRSFCQLSFRWPRSPGQFGLSVGLPNLGKCIVKLGSDSKGPSVRCGIDEVGGPPSSQGVAIGGRKIGRDVVTSRVKVSEGTSASGVTVGTTVMVATVLPTVLSVVGSWREL